MGSPLAREEYEHRRCAVQQSEVNAPNGGTPGIDGGMNPGYTGDMANVKTAISLQQSLFERVKQLARDLDVPRSRIFVMALEEFIRGHENRNLLKRINAAYDDSPESERKRLRQMRRSHRRIVKGEW
jgi:hypothetical protein